jgi:hypothetical protein
VSFVTKQLEALSAPDATLWGGVANVPPSLPGGLPRAIGAAAPRAPGSAVWADPTAMAQSPSGDYEASVI